MPPKATQTVWGVTAGDEADPTATLDDAYGDESQNQYTDNQDNMMDLDSMPVTQEDAI